MIFLTFENVITLLRALRNSIVIKETENNTLMSRILLYLVISEGESL